MSFKTPRTNNRMPTVTPQVTLGTNTFFSPRPGNDVTVCQPVAQGGEALLSPTDLPPQRINFASPAAGTDPPNDTSQMFGFAVVGPDLRCVTCDTKVGKSRSSVSNHVSAKHPSLVDPIKEAHDSIRGFARFLKNHLQLW